MALSAAILFGASSPISKILLGQIEAIPHVMFLIAFPIMILGTVLLLKEEHIHIHMHRHAAIMHEHRHNHQHADGQIITNGYHSHMHNHEALEHIHPHSPDIHHRHEH